MINFISKLLDLFVHPEVILMLMILVGGMVHNRKTRRWLWGSAAGLFLLLTQGFLFMVVQNAWNDRQYEPWPTRHYAYCFVSGGVTAGYDSLTQLVQYGEAVDRMHVASLFIREGICDTLVISGDAASNSNGGNPDGFRRHCERLLGIPAERIKVEPNALTTMQNFEYSIPLMQHGSCITINSARYMARTRLCAELQHFPTDFYSVQQLFAHPDYEFQWVMLIPRVFYLGNWYSLFHEWAGYLWYCLLYGW